MDNNEMFDYKISVIVPVYNSEEFIANTLDSVVNQIFPLKDIEVLMIDDGSTDNGASVCKEYADKYPTFKLFQKENEGISKTRNFGIEHAHGKYIIYLDADDTFSSETIKNVYRFFENHYDEVDLVTFPIIQYVLPSMKKSPAHTRYNILRESKVYDLTEFENIYIVQTTMNICVKNMPGNNVLFDPDLTLQEDQKYITMVLMNKMKIGYCREASYNYFRHEGSATIEKFYPQNIFEKSTSYFEWLFAQYEPGKIPKYIQAIVFHDINWKNKLNILYPWHLEGDEYDKAYKRIINLLNQIDTDVIANHPIINNFHKQYFLSLKENNAIYPFVSKRGVYLIDADTSAVTYYCKRIEIVLEKIRVHSGKIEFLGHIKSPLFNYMDKPKLFVYENDKKVEKSVDLFSSSFSYYQCKTKTNNFWAFYYQTDVDTDKSIEFFVDIDGMECVTKLNATDKTPFYENARDSYVIANTKISIDDNKLFVSPIDEQEFWAERDAQNAEYIKQPSIYNHRASCKKYSGRRIWIYVDCYTVDFDNAYYQFLNDWNKDDGVERYYIITKDFDCIRHCFDKSMMKHLVIFGSTHHKDLFINCEKIITAFVEFYNYSPFDKVEYQYYCDLLNYEIVYLQHGILHASTPWKYTPEGILADKVVISSYFEKENLTKKYGWRTDQLIECGMPRYDFIDKNTKAKNRIIFAPSWRNYLIGNLGINADIDEEGSTKKLVNSNYYKNITAFINNQKLCDLLEENDLYLDVKLHPIFYKPYKKLVSVKSKRVNITANKVNLGDYKMFLTDFSSFVYDYAYLCRPIHYFVPDYIEYISGMNVYRELDLPFDKAFGTLSTNPQDAIDAIERAIKSDFEVQEPFKQRMQSFYLPLENCCENLYKALTEKED